jgi:hypothetical protein
MIQGAPIIPSGRQNAAMLGLNAALTAGNYALYRYSKRKLATAKARAIAAGVPGVKLSAKERVMLAGSKGAGRGGAGRG